MEGYARDILGEAGALTWTTSDARGHPGGGHHHGAAVRVLTIPTCLATPAARGRASPATSTWPSASPAPPRAPRRRHPVPGRTFTWTAAASNLPAPLFDRGSVDAVVGVGLIRSHYPLSLPPPSTSPVGPWRAGQTSSTACTPRRQTSTSTSPSRVTTPFRRARERQVIDEARAMLAAHPVDWSAARPSGFTALRRAALDAWRRSCAPGGPSGRRAWRPARSAGATGRRGKDHARLRCLTVPKQSPPTLVRDRECHEELWPEGCPGTHHGGAVVVTPHGGRAPHRADGEELLDAPPPVSSRCTGRSRARTAAMAPTARLPRGCWGLTRTTCASATPADRAGRGLAVSFKADPTSRVSHPNTVDVWVRDANGDEAHGPRRVHRRQGPCLTMIDGLSVQITGVQRPHPLRARRAGRARAHRRHAGGGGVSLWRAPWMYRSRRGGEAFNVLEVDGPVSREVREAILASGHQPHALRPADGLGAPPDAEGWEPSMEPGEAGGCSRRSTSRTRRSSSPMPRRTGSPGAGVHGARGGVRGHARPAPSRRRSATWTGCWT